MYECLDLFSTPTKAWFKHAFKEPTDAQQAAWPAIRSGKNVLVIAPTGSGKTLCAFLSAIDRLMGERAARSASERGAATADGTASPGVRASTQSTNGIAQGKRQGGRTRRTAAKGVTVLYVSPLKALAVDVAKNLQAPLDGIAAQCEAMGMQPPSIAVATRSGDTTPQERRAIVSHPPDILVTTPESLYLLLTSKARRILTTVDTVIVDEVHALAGTKRGAHLALSLERLDLLTARPAQRIGLSATVNPPEEAARFLGGVQPVTVVNPGERPAMDLRVVEPLANMRDLQSANVPSRAGGTEAQKATAQHISGVTPAMQRLAERRGIAGMAVDGGTSASPAGGRTVGSDSIALTGAAGERTSGSIWPVVERSILDEILAHHTTLVFVNSRGLAEKLTARLNDRYADMRGTGHAIASPEGREEFAQHYDAVVGSTTMLVQSHGADDVIAMAHHGSVSKDRRKQIEEQLKRGQLRCVVATSSLELGIDMGSVDLVIQVSPPLSVASGLQRVGRADHRVGGVSHALFYPLTREQIVGVAASIESMTAGDLEPLAVPRNPLDILAQQTVAAAAMDDLTPDDWYATVRKAAPFADLGRDMFDAVMGMMTGAYNTEEFSAFRPPLMWNHDDDLIAARPGAQRLAVTSGGTIPDRGLYTVVLPEADAGKGPRRVGELDEEMVYESRVGDVITLGTSTWQIQEITRDRVIVTPAPGRTARLPFWHGEESGRDYGFGKAKGRFLREVAGGLQSSATIAHVPGGAETSGGAGAPDQGPRFDEAIERRLRGDGLDDNAIDNLARLLAEQQASTGIVPSDRAIVIERCPDEEGDWRVIIHSPFGRRVHEPWAMAITTRLKQRYGFDGQAYAADDGIVLRLPEGEGTIPIRELVTFDPDDLQRVVETQVGESVLFAARFRECAARSLFLPRTEPGKRVPLWQQRLRAAQLLNAARLKRNFPLLLETARECLQDVYDLPALREIMTGLNAGTITLRETDTQTPSPLAENLLFGFVGSVMYQYDVPQAERSAQLLSMDPDVLERLLGTTDLSAVLDPDVIAEVEDQLAQRTFWNELAADDIDGRVARYAKTHGPFTADRLIGDLHIDATEAVHALDRLQSQGELLNGAFLHGITARQWLHKDVFRRIRSRSLAKARAAIKPVAPDIYQAFLLDRQGVGPVGGERYHGEDGLMRVIEQLEGVALPLDVWENGVFPARVGDYAPSMLDELVADGEVTWIGSKIGDTKADEPGMVAFHPSDSVMLPVIDGAEHSTRVAAASAASAAAVERADEAEEDALTIPDAILSVLSSGGAYRADQLAVMTNRLWQEESTDVDPQTGEILPRAWSDSQFEEALWSLVWQGKATNSSLTPIRALAAGTRKVRAPARASRRRVRVQVGVPARMGGLWSLVGNGMATPEPATPGPWTIPREAVGNAVSGEESAVVSATGFGRQAEAGSSGETISPEQHVIALTEALLDRYGVIAQPLVDQEGIPGGFSALYPVLKRMEETGTLVRGMFVRGFGAAQFADKDTVNALRDAEHGHSQSNVALDATDPANLTGSAIAWPAIPSAIRQPSPETERTAADAGNSAPAYEKGAATTTIRRTGTAGRPARRAGTIVVLGQGRPVLYAAPRTHRIIAFDRTETVLRPACSELAFALRRTLDNGTRTGNAGGITFADLSGESLIRGGDAARILHAAGFTPCPQGMKLYR
ncbi:DEAD/DEAH box helicase [Bifidobacterium sp. 82T10]|uniref:DEAD/DEAH box helicase n=1 Tax=Bifidobacterium miconis TaxID=2834435 RepID=A0ABS6WE85_9BIFI|nr:DEAD/DEAH box helicase [Bifidobacterium miconis]MBW3092252.1 DEAD/DEAH box helicase [Bifidobacterium miconis]